MHFGNSFIDKIMLNKKTQIEDVHKNRCRKSRQCHVLLHHNGLQRAKAIKVAQLFSSLQARSQTDTVQNGLGHNKMIHMVPH